MAATALAWWLAVATHLPLALVVKRQAKRIAKGHQGAFHRVGFRLLDGRFAQPAGLGARGGMSRGPSNRPPLSPREGWGRQVLHFQPVRWDRWNQPVEVTVRELLLDQAVSLLIWQVIC